MTPTPQGSIRLFRLAGIDVFLHWSWFLVAVYEVNNRGSQYPSIVWNVFEYVALFLIVLMHEFGHSLACRQVGGKADQIVLWPLGGVAYVAPPQRPGAMLWSIAAGPLVNVILAPILLFIFVMGPALGLSPNAYALVRAVCFMNLFMLIFNLLPIYPLDGGQILRSLLWFLFGRARSLMVATVVGFIGVGALILVAILVRQPWFVILSIFILLNCWRGLLQARVLARVARLPRREGFSCPDCKQPPVSGAFWRCAKCLKPFDAFATQGTCPNCGAQYPATRCLDCGQSFPFNEWVAPAPSSVPPPV